MKTYSNDPQDYTLEDACSDKFDDMRWSELTESMIEYFKFNPHALDSFKEWWIEQEIKHANDDEDDHIADMAWHDYQHGD